MANSPEGGFSGFLRGVFERFFRTDAQRRAARQVNQQQERRPREEEEEKKSNITLITEELKRVTEQHPAREILGNITFERTTLNNTDLQKLLLDILHADPTLYHDQKWLENKLQRLEGLINTPALPPGFDLNTVGIVENRVESLLKRTFEAEKDVRDAVTQEKLKRVKRGQELTPEEADRIAESAGESTSVREQSTGTGIKEERNRETVEIEKGAIKALLANTNIPVKITERIKNAKKELDKKEGNLTEAEKEALTNEEKKEIKETGILDYWHRLGGAFESSLKTMVNDMAEKTKHHEIISGADIENYETVKQAYQKTAREFVDKYGRDKSRIYQIAQGGTYEFLEKAIHEDENYMDYWFYHIIEPILYNQRSTPHRELFNLYVAGDMDIFLEMVRRKKDAQGNSIGLKLANRYIILLNTIFQSHDMDFYAAHPSQDMKEFIGNTSLFLNQYIDAAHQDPMVSMAKRLYESGLLRIRETNDGFIPREWLAWQEGKLTSKLDEMVEKDLINAIASGQLHHIKIDPITGLPAPSGWNRKQISDKAYTLDDLYGGQPAQSEDWRRTVGDLKIASALKQAKGLALVDLRFLEIISLSKGTGSDFYNKSVSSFNSVPYEGIVRHLEPIIHYFTRFKVGFEYYDVFMNMMIAEWKDFDPHQMKELIKIYHRGSHEDMEKYIKEHNLPNALSTRLLEMDNPFSFSGMWGTMTKWRVADASSDFDDWERDRTYGTAVKITNIGDSYSGEKRKDTFNKKRTYAEKKVRQFIIEVKNGDRYWELRSEYRQYLRESNDIRLRTAAEKDQADRGNPYEFNDEFEEHWRKIGIKQKKVGATQTYQQIFDDIWNKERKPGIEDPDICAGEVAALIKKLERAYKARTWVQAVMRSPLIVARELETKWTKHGFEKSGPLRKKLIYEILGIDLDEVAAQRTPKAWEEAGFDRISDLEGALAAMQQVAIRDNRDLTDQDFNNAIDEIGKSINDPNRKEELKQAYIYAKEYWKKVRQVMLGDYADNATEVYRRLGIEDATTEHNQGLRFHKIHWDSINNINLIDKESKGKFIVQELQTDLLNNKLIDREWRHLFSTEDMGWEYLNIGALGERNPVRRAGDLGSHVAFGQLFEKYVTEQIVAQPKIEDLAKAQKEMFEAMSGDFVDIAVEAVGRIFYTTGMIYRKADWAWKYGPISAGLSLVKDASIIQIIRGRDRATAWGPNEMLQYVQAVSGLQVIPKRRYSGLGGGELAPQSEWDAGLMGKRLGGTKNNAMWEIINTVAWLAAVIMIYRALTAQEKEQEG